MRRMRRTLAALATATLIATIAACAPGADPRWSPPQWPEAELAVVSAAPEPLDPASVTGVVGQRLRNDDVGIQARFAYLPGSGAQVTPFNERVDAVVRGAVEERTASVGGHYRPTAFPRGAGLDDRGCARGSTVRPASELLADPALGPAGGAGTVVVCDVVVAAGSVAAEAIRVVTGGPDGIQSDTSTILYADTATGAVASASELWAEGAAEALGADVVEALRRDAGALSLTASDGSGEAQRAAIDAALATTLPSPDGGFVITIASGFTTPELTELGLQATASPLTVEIPRATAERFATEMGRTVLAAAGQPYAGPPDAPAGADRVVCSLVPCVALTYDDGPGAPTGTLLDTLRDTGSAATFFMLGSNASGNPDMVRRVAAEGHEIGNHTWNHPQLPKLDDAAVARQVGDTRALLQQLSGQAVATFRPPYGEYDARVLAVAGVPAILWNVDTRDWAGPSDEVLIDRGVTEAGPGGIILFHDIHDNSVRVAPAVISGLRDRGFALATVSQLFGGAPPASGAWRAAPQP